jgi:hypothetical protein
MPHRSQPFSAKRGKTTIGRIGVVASRHSGRILLMVCCGCRFGGVPQGPASPAVVFVCHPAIPTFGPLAGEPCVLQDGGVRPSCGRTSQEERNPTMRLRFLLVPLTFALLALTSGCHHRHWCHGGCCTPCCSPCGGTCCGYGPVEGPMPPLAAPVVAPHIPVGNIR